MQKQTLQQNFRNYKNAKNTQYHCHRKNINKALNQIMNKKTDRRTIQGRGTPQTNENIYQKRITYNIEINGHATHVENNMAHKNNKTPYNMHANTTKTKNR